MLRTLEYFMPRVRRANLFGTQLRFLFPRQQGREMDIPELKLTKNTLPGKESIGFYDTIYNLDTLCRTQFECYSEDDKTEDSKIIDDAFENEYWPDRLVGTRRWYLASPVFIDVCHFCDIWVCRNNNFGDLREGEQMFKAHRHLLKLMYHFDEIDYKEKGYAFDTFGRVLSGVAWKEQVLNGRKWLSYQEYSRGYFWGECWLTPIGPEHYINVRMYMMENNRRKKYTDAIKQYIERIMDGVRISTDDSVLDLAAEFESREHELFDLDGLPEISRYRKHVRRFENAIGAEKNQFTDEIEEDALESEENRNDLKLEEALKNEADEEVDDELLLDMGEDDCPELVVDSDGIDNFDYQPGESETSYDGLFVTLTVFGGLVLIVVLGASIIRGGVHLTEHFDTPLIWIFWIVFFFGDSLIKWTDKKMEDSTKEH